jgi:cytochrome c-type biogenesis protein CcmH
VQNRYWKVKSTFNEFMAMSFWIAVAALLALALALLIIPLMRATRVPQADQRQQQNIQIAREKKLLLETQLADGEIDQVGYDAAYLDLQGALALELDRNEGQGEAARGKWMALLVLLAIPCASLSLYLVFGDYRVIQNPQIVQAPVHQQNTTAPEMTLDEMVVAIEKRLQNNPDDAEAWFMLGRTHMGKRQYDEAVKAFRRSNQLMADDPGILFALSDALAMQNNGSLLGEPEALIQRGLQLAPRFPNGLWLAGMAAEQRQDFKSAHQYWSTLLPMISDNAESTNEVTEMLAMLEQRDPSLVKAVATDRELKLRIDISAELRAQASPETAVFVYAKAMQGPPMPLAVKRLQLKDLPVTLSLSDADAMMPTMKLSSFDQVIVGARVSLSGNPVAQDGDFYTEQNSVNRANPPPQIDLTIDRVKSEQSSKSAGELTLSIDIKAALRAQATPDTAVFIYAKAMQGPPMPLAVKRLQLKDLPVTLSLSDADAMMPSMKLSSFEQVIVGARVSFSGNAVAQSGDFYTEQDSVDSSNPPAPISLTIDKVK